MDEDEDEGRPSEDGSEATSTEDAGSPSAPEGGSEGRRPTDPRTRRRLELLLVLGVALIIGTLVVALLYVPPSTRPAPVPCTPGAPPPTTSNAEVALAARSSVYPAPANGSQAAEQFVLWVNATAVMLPGTNVSFAVVPLPGSPSGAACELPIPDGAWKATPSSSTLGPSTTTSVSVVGTPTTSYVRAGVFLVQVWMNATNEAGSPTLGSLHTELTVG